MECKFCLVSSLLCARKEGGHTAGFTFTITVMIKSSLIIIPRMSTPIEKWLHTTHTKQLLWLIASGPAIYTTHGLVFLASADYQFTICLSQYLCRCVFLFLCPANMLDGVYSTLTLKMMMANLPESHNAICPELPGVLFCLGFFIVCFLLRMMDDRQPCR